MGLTLANELSLTSLANTLLFGGCIWILVVRIFSGERPQYGLYLMVLGWMMLTLAIVYRWLRISHGPFITMYEILLSNLWSLTLIWMLAYWRKPSLRIPLSFIMPLFFIFMAWLLVTRPDESFFPATYETIWLYFHVILGKIFFGSLMIATALSISILASPYYSEKLKLKVPSINSHKQLIGKILLVALIFDSLMLIAGAVWAHNAWGRFWAWDPLETWAFACWLFIGLIMHIDVSWKISARFYACLVILAFVLAFLTFYGIPFISHAPHQGVV